MDNQEIPIPEEELNPINAHGSVKISSDKMQAYIILTAPQNGGDDLSKSALLALLDSNGVCYGIDRAAVEALADKPVYDEPKLAARGSPVEHGKDASLKYYIRKEKDFRPKVMPDGSIDYKTLDLIDNVVEGSLLCEKIPETNGVSGMDVLGKIILARSGKTAVIPAGKNTELSPDGLTLVSTIIGQADFVKGKICVLDTLTIAGDVSAATGDIRFSGNVIVKGGVLSGFTIRATGNVDITGFVEAARIVTDGNLVIRSGFSGGSSGEINVGGNATVSFIQGGTVSVGKNLETTYILNSKVFCGGAVNLSGRGLIMGGSVTARISVTANIIGSASNPAQTHIEVGNDPEIIRRYHSLPKLISECDANIARIEVQEKVMRQLSELGRLPADRVEQFQRTVEELENLRTSRTDMDIEYEELKVLIPELANGWIKVLKTAYPGVRFSIGADQMLLQNEYTFMTFSINKDKDGISTAPAR